MVRGTHEEFRFTIPYIKEEIASIKIIFWQEGRVGTTAQPFPIVKTGISPEVVWCASNVISVVLNPEETLRFTDEKKAYTQFMGILTSGRKFGNKPKMFSVDPTYDDIIIEDITVTEDDIAIFDGGIIF